MPAVVTAVVLSAVFGDMILAAAALGTFGLAAASFAITMVTSFVITSVVSRVFGQQQQGGGASDGSSGVQQGNRVQLPPSTNNKIPVVYGSAFIKPIIVDAKISTDNQTMWYVLTFSEAMESDSIGTFSFGDIYWADKKLTFDDTDKTKVVSWTDSSGATDTKVSGHLNLYLYRDGSEKSVAAGQPGYTTQKAWEVLQDSGIASDQRWDTTKKMSKLVFAIVKVNYNPDATLTGLSEITAQLNNSLSAPGAVIQDYFTNTRYGAGLDVTKVDTTSLSTLDTYAAQQITYVTADGTSTSTKNRYTINGPVDTSKNYLDNVLSLTDSCDCWLKWNEVNNQWSIITNQAVTTASITSVTSSNIVGGVNIIPVDLNSTYNSVTVTYPNDKARDQNDYYTLGIDYFTNIERSMNEPDNALSISLPFTNNIVQAQYIACRRLLQSREDLAVNFTMDYSGIQLDAGDVIGILHERYGWDVETYGSNGKLFRINQVSEAKSDDGVMYAKISASEYNAQVYADDNITLRDYNLSLNTGIPDPSNVATPGVPTFTSVNTASTVPSFVVNSVAASSGSTQAIEFWYGNTSTFSTTAFSLWFTETSGAGYYPYGTTVSTTVDGLSAGNYWWTARAVGSRTKSEFTSVSTKLTWNPSVSAGTSTTSTDSQNVRHDPIAGFTGALPIALSTSSSYAPVTNHTGLNYNPSAQQLGVGSAIAFANQGPRVVAEMTDNTTATNRLIFQTDVVNGASGVLVMPNGTNSTSSWNALSSSDPTQSALVAVRMANGEGQLYGSRWGTVPHVNLGFYTSATRRMTINSSTGIVNILSASASTSTTTGGLQVVGGVGIGGNLNVGGTITSTGKLNSPGTYHCEVARSSNTATSTSTDVVIYWNKSNSDPNTWLSGNTQIKPNVSGYYLVQGQVNFAPGSGTGQINSQIRKNGSTFALAQHAQPTAAGTSLTQSLVGIVQLNGTTDYIDMTTYSSSPTGQTISGSADGAWTKLVVTKLQ